MASIKALAALSDIMSAAAAAAAALSETSGRGAVKAAEKLAHDAAAAYTTATFKGLTDDQSRYYEKQLATIIADVQTAVLAKAKAPTDMAALAAYTAAAELESCLTWFRFVGHDDGLRIWVDGYTYDNRSELKKAGFKWCESRGAWYWAPVATEKKTA